MEFDTNRALGFDSYKTRNRYLSITGTAAFTNRCWSTRCHLRLLNVDSGC